MSDVYERPSFAMPYPGIFRVTCPTPFPGLPHVHVYVAEGAHGGLIVIDTAMPGQDTFDRISRGIESMGRRVTDIEAIYLTHCHPDHFGGAGLLQQASGAPVVCHPICKDQLERMHNPDASRFAKMMNIFVEHGRSPENLEEMVGPRASFMSQMVLPQEMTTIDEGDTVTFGQGEWDIYWTPGHEEGHVVFHRRADGVCIVGDTVLGKITPHIGWQVEPPDPLGQFLDSLEKVAKLDPTLVLPGHGRPFDEGAERARSIASHHAQRLRRCLDIVIRRGPAHALQIARDLFDRDLMFFEERLALAETLSHLEYLRLRGRVGREMVNDTWFYNAPRDLVP
jgi:glyoxylase-like metal-dependent hydrolase (beta-lactamase superfamily II)